MQFLVRNVSFHSDFNEILNPHVFPKKVNVSHSIKLTLITGVNQLFVSNSHRLLNRNKMYKRQSIYLLP